MSDSVATLSQNYPLAVSSIWKNRGKLAVWRMKLNCLSGEHHVFD